MQTAIPYHWFGLDELWAFTPRGLRIALVIRRGNGRQWCMLPISEELVARRTPEAQAIIRLPPAEIEKAAGREQTSAPCGGAFNGGAGNGMPGSWQLGRTLRRHYRPRAA